ncbi:F-box/LRR-repeat protein At4g14103-like [Malania oleifera]|uniref:F-box/LRR-repeat protein At4g14103-like n=1 Tax=Malania oleifera TaxID=397392 RepID=UPI0025AE89F5|nr:F-box/LRR-repeat protein At4g14103-like [Malania oleifera]
MGFSRLRRKIVLEDAEDRISSLPDSIICHIFSFLPTKDAVRSSVLSTRWKYLFVSSPNLDFDDLSFLGVASRPRFVNFIYRLLALRGSSHVNRFRLRCYVNHDDPHVNTWISAAVRRNVQELEIELHIMCHTRGSNLRLLPYDLLICKTLVVLKLDVACDLNVPSDVSFPRLKTLHLQSLYVEYDSFKKIVFGCPVLEDLLTCDCRFKQSVQVFDISVPTLKRLTLGLQYLPFAQFHDTHVVVDAPYLQCLRYEDNIVKKGHTLKGLTSLVEAHISINLSMEQNRESIFYGPSVAKLFEAISKVQSLHFAGYSTWVIQVTQPCLPTFSNLTHLEVVSDDVISLELLAELLRRSPNLEVLVVGQVYKDGEGSMNFPIRIGNLSSHLKEVELQEFTGDEDELELVEYLLDSAEILEKMKIVILSSRDRLPIAQKLLKLPRRSRTCRLFVT